VSEGERDRTHQRLHLLREEYGAEYHVTAMFPLEPLMRLYCCKISASLRGKILDTVNVTNERVPHIEKSITNLSAADLTFKCESVVRNW
jgi:hypothetical protein